MPPTGQFSIRIIVDAVNNAVSVLTSVGNQVSNIAQQTQKLTNATVDLSKGSSGIDAISKSYGSLASGISSLIAVFTGGALAKSIFETAASFEVYRAQLENAYHSSQKAGEIFEQIKNMAIETPFEIGDLTRAWVLLKNYGLEPNLQMLRDMGDAAAAFGGSKDTLDGIIRAFGQMQAKGKVYTEELRQLAERGVPAFSILQQKLGLTSEQMNRLGRESISADSAIRALLEGIRERYGGQMEKLSHTLVGIFSNLKDAIKIAFEEIATAGAVDELKKSLQDVIDTIQRLRQSGEMEIWAKKIGAVLSELVQGLKDVVADFIWVGKTISTVFGGSENYLTPLISQFLRLGVEAMTIMYIFKTIGPIIVAVVAAFKSVSVAVALLALANPAGIFLALATMAAYAVYNIIQAGSALNEVAKWRKVEQEAIEENVRLKQREKEIVAEANKQLGTSVTSYKALINMQKEGLIVIKATNDENGKLVRTFEYTEKGAARTAESQKKVVVELNKTSEAMGPHIVQLVELAKTGEISAQSVAGLSGAYDRLKRALDAANKAIAENRNIDVKEIVASVKAVQKEYANLEKDLARAEKAYNKAVKDAESSLKQLNALYKSQMETLTSINKSTTDEVVRGLEEQKQKLEAAMKPDVNKIREVESEIARVKIDAAKQNTKELVEIANQRYAREKELARAKGQEVASIERERLTTIRGYYQSYLNEVSQLLSSARDANVKYSQEVAESARSLKSVQTDIAGEIRELGRKLMTPLDAYKDKVREIQSLRIQALELVRTGGEGGVAQGIQMLDQLKSKISSLGGEEKSQIAQQQSLLRSLGSAYDEAYRKKDEAAKQGMEASKKEIEDYQARIKETKEIIDDLNSKLQEGFKIEFKVEDTDFKNKLLEVEKLRDQKDALVQVKAKLDDTFEQAEKAIAQIVEPHTAEVLAKVDREGVESLEGLLGMLKEIDANSYKKVTIDVVENHYSTGGSVSSEGYSEATGGHIPSGRPTIRYPALASMRERIQGFIPGWGTKDDVPAKLMRGEYVLNKESVKEYGLPFINAINRMKIPKELLNVKAILTGIPEALALPITVPPSPVYSTGGLVDPTTGGGTSTFVVRLQAGNMEVPLTVVGSPAATGKALKALERELSRKRLTHA